MVVPARRRVGPPSAEDPQARPRLSLLPRLTSVGPMLGQWTGGDEAGAAAPGGRRTRRFTSPLKFASRRALPPPDTPPPACHPESHCGSALQEGPPPPSRDPAFKDESQRLPRKELSSGRASSPRPKLWDCPLSPVGGPFPPGNPPFAPDNPPFPPGKPPLVQGNLPLGRSDDTSPLSPTPVLKLWGCLPRLEPLQLAPLALPSWRGPEEACPVGSCHVDMSPEALAQARAGGQRSLRLQRTTAPLGTLLPRANTFSPRTQIPSPAPQGSPSQGPALQSPPCTAPAPAGPPPPPSSSPFSSASHSSTSSLSSPHSIGPPSTISPSPAAPPPPNNSPPHSIGPPSSITPPSAVPPPPTNCTPSSIGPSSPAPPPSTSPHPPAAALPLATDDDEEEDSFIFTPPPASPAAPLPPSMPVTALNTPRSKTATAASPPSHGIIEALPSSSDASDSVVKAPQKQSRSKTVTAAGPPSYGNIQALPDSGVASLSMRSISARGAPPCISPRNGASEVSSFGRRWRLKPPRCPPRQHPDCPVFTPQQLSRATSNWAAANVLGKGGFGTVYKGRLGGVDVAVKRLDAQGWQGSREYGMEVQVLTAVQHPNVVRLLGHCPETQCLVYEFVGGGNLQEYLCMKYALRGVLKWWEKIHMLEGLVSALVALHHANPPVVHRDVKPENVLLGDDATAKLADFGLSRVAKQGCSNRTYTVSGTAGYIDPESMRSFEISPLSDVYAFGLIVLQLLNRMPRVTVVHNLLKGMAEGPDGGGMPSESVVEKVFEYIGQRAKEWPQDILDGLVRLALRCVQRKAAFRPDLATEVLPFLKQAKRQKAALYTSKEKAGLQKQLAVFRNRIWGSRMSI